MRESTSLPRMLIIVQKCVLVNKESAKMRIFLEGL